EFESKPFNFTHMAVGDIQRDVSYKCLLGRDLVSGSSDSGQLADYSEAERSPRQISQVEHYDLNGGGEQLFSLTDVIRNNRHLYVNQQSPRRGVDRINHDRTREATFRRLRAVTARIRQATSGVCDGLQRLSQDVRNHLQRKSGVKAECEQLVRASKDLERSVPTVNAILRHEVEVEKNQQSRGMSL
ncbi:hypothetical protein, partial [Photobacterium indicum]|uniref:hypothetical protein n=1 Tax=Photobacterium indicum TaxID=81447 RepID=UPI003D0DFD96